MTLSNEDLVKRLRDYAVRFVAANGEPTTGTLLASEAANALEAATRERDEALAVLQSPEALHANMLRGGVAKLSIRQALHLHGEAALAKWDAAESSEANLALAVEALEPFAAFIGGDTRLPDTMPLTQGSPMARQQVTVADFRRARTTLSRIRGTE